MGSPSQGLTRPGHFGTMPDNPEIWKAVAMADHFEKIQKLPDPIPGVPNFRRVPGYKQLRENIAESKLSYEIMDDAAQVFLKSKIMDNIHKYFYMIAFTGYIREMAAMAISTATDEDKAKHGLAGGKISTPGDQLKLAKTFVAWMEESPS